MLARAYHSKSDDHYIILLALATPRKVNSLADWSEDTPSAPCAGLVPEEQPILTVTARSQCRLLNSPTNSPLREQSTDALT